MMLRVVEFARKLEKKKKYLTVVIKLAILAPVKKITLQVVRNL